MIFKVDYSGYVDVSIDGKIVSKEYTCYKGDTVPKELEAYLAKDLPDVMDAGAPSEKAATSPKDKMVFGSYKNKKG